MPPRKTARYCLYRTFVDAYMKGHPEKTRSVSSDSTIYYSIFVFLNFSNLIQRLKRNGIE
jgi:hypothetical protein